MKIKWFCLAVAGVMPVIAVCPAWANEGEETPPTQPQVVVIRSMDGSGEIAKGVTVEVKVEDGEGEAEVVVQEAEPFNIALSVPADPNRGWLGVQLSEVPPALAHHLRTGGGTGVMVSNIVTGSPADQAGMQQYDVLTTINGKAVSGVGSVAEAIGSAAPGSRVSLKVVREGAEQSMQITLASRPAGEDMEWKHEFAPDAEIRERITTRGKILRRDKDGNFKLEDLGDLEALKNLPDDIKALMPKIDELKTKVWVDDQNRSFSSVVSRDGESIAVEQESGGQITVKRTDKDGQTTEATYADAEALKAADAEAHEIYEEAQGGAAGEGKRFLFSFPGGQFNLEGHGEWREQIHNAMREAREAMKGAQKSADEARKRYQFRFQNAPGHPFFLLDENGDGSSFSWTPEGRTFRVTPEGQIEVTIRKGDSEVTKVFKDEADMAARDPELHEAYSEVLSDKEE